MSKINRSNTVYVHLPDEFSTTSMPDAKCMTSINVLVPKGMEKKAASFIDDMHDDIAKKFKKFVKKEIEKRARDD